MKKVIGILIIAALSSFNANAEVSVGITGNAGLLDATGKETFNSGTTTRKEELGIAYVSGFAELHVPLEIGAGQFRVGGSFVPYALDEGQPSVVGTEILITDWSGHCFIALTIYIQRFPVNGMHTSHEYNVQIMEA